MSPTQRPTVGICLEIETSEGACERLSTVLARTRIEAVLIRPTSPQAGQSASTRELCTTSQNAGAAALIYADAALAASLKADGVHLPWSKDIVAVYAEARKLLGKQSIVGAEAGHSRHDAMELGEAGADYVAFLPPNGDTQALSDLVSWWTELFEVPSLAMGVTSVEQASVLTTQGADFIGWRLIPGQSSADITAALSALSKHLRAQSEGWPGGAGATP